MCILPVVAVDAVPHLWSLNSALDESGIFEFLEVLTDGSLGYGQFVMDVTEVAFLSAGEKLQYLNPCRMGKRNKQDLCRHVARLFKQGKSEEEVRVAQASRFGYAKHADCIHLFKSIGMENSLGKIIKRRRIKAPFQGMVSTQKVKFSSICKMLLNVNGGGESHTWNKKIYLVDYLIEDSKIEKTQVSVKVQDSNGQIRDVLQQQPGKVLAIRFKKIIKTEERTSESGEVYEHYEFEKLRDAQGNPTLVDAEYYSYTGSKILIDQALNDFSKEDLPSPTVVQQFQGKNGQTFFKFT